MSASFRSHFRHAPQEEENGTSSKRKQPSHLPIRNSVAENKQTKTTQHVSKLAKRASRTISSSDSGEHGTRNTNSTPTPAMSGHVPQARSKRISVVPPSGLSLADVASVSAKRRPSSTTRTPSLISGTTASTLDSLHSHGLRRKTSTVERWALNRAAEAGSATFDRATMHNTKEEYDDSILGISPPKVIDVADESISRQMQESMSREWPTSRYVTPPVPNYAQSITPSTHYTDSPFSHVPTPSSASSYSPSITTTTNNAPHSRRLSPARSRPPMSGRLSDQNDPSRLGLPPVRESSTSSSNSTVKPASSRQAVPRKEIPRKAPSAPPTVGPPVPSKQPPQRQASTRPVVKPVATGPSVQIPPELAHLNVDAPVNSLVPKTLAPRRPSRDNTPSITDMKQPSPIVQSDLPPLYTTYHKRTPSQETQGSATSPSVRSRFGLSSKTSSRQQSPRIDSAISPPPSARIFARGATPELPAPEVRQLSRTDSPAIGPMPSPSKSPRFGFFSRKPKVEAPKVAERPKREPRKGPVAGTGHEGYARFGLRGRSGSSTSSTGFRSPSADSTASSVPRPTTSRKGSFGSSKDGSDLDDFLRERLTPVILRGSGSTNSNANSNVDSQPLSVSSTNSSSIDSYPRPTLLPSAMQSETSISPVERGSPSLRDLSDISRSDSSQGLPTLAARRSLTRLSRTESRSPVCVPAHVDTRIASRQEGQPMQSVSNPVVAHKDTGVPSIGDTKDGVQSGRVQSPDSGPTPKATRKWNFFQRAQASPRPKGKEKVPATRGAANQPAYRSVAHYAMMDPVEPVDLYEVEQILQEHEGSADDSMSETLPITKVVPYERRHTSLLPSPPKVDLAKKSEPITRPTLPKIMIRRDSSESPVLMRAQPARSQPLPQLVDIPKSPNTAQSTAATTQARPILDTPPPLCTPEMSGTPFGIPGGLNEPDSPKQPRLSPVGRIPRVVSKRDRDRKLPDNSFSRPFQRTQPHPSVRPPGVLYNQIRDLASPIEPSSQPVSSTSTRSDIDQKGSNSTNPPSVSTNRTSLDNANEFFAFSPRKDSQVTYSSSSGGQSWIAAMAAPSSLVDDPWNEYNDLLDDMMPQKTPISAGSSLGAPFQYSTMLTHPASSFLPTPLNFSDPPSTELPPPPRAATVPAVLSVPQQIARFMQPSMSPLTPHTLSDFVDSYGDWRTSGVVTPNRQSQPRQSRTSLPQPQRMSGNSIRASLSSSRYSRASAHSRSASLPEANARHSQASLTPSVRFNRDTQLLDIAESDIDDQASVANLRFGALMTSKWLSFGRVLFSPAHNEMRLADEPRVLVVDGLGSDWSYYVALSYPAATVYNLGPALVNGSTSWPGINQRPPPNHKHIPHAAISASFPFPKGFFTAVVFRFPAVGPEQAYQACICECKRVLRPGGHLEVAVLDLDLMNMGSKARRVVRGLKTRLQQRDETVCLRNVGDVLVRMIGRRGFEEVQRCIVGVPAAGRIPRSQDISDTSSGYSNNRPGWRRETNNSNDKEISFADLLEDARHSRVEPTHNNDEGITKMVAKVGRWWYSSCYEEPTLRADRSIWDDPSLLRECEKQGTSFRLLICYAQKPAQTRRRTVSV